MNANNIPERGIDFDDFIGTMYLEDEKGLENVQMIPVFCPANEKHDDDFVGIRYQGYSTKEVPSKKVRRGQLISGIIYPAKNFTAEDLERLFVKVEMEDGTVHYSPNPAVSFDEVYIRVCYSKSEDKEDTLKWVAAVDGGEAVVLHGDRRAYNPKDAEE